MLPAAPGRLSTITCWPNSSESFWAIGRAVVSVPPPTAKPTIMRTGLVGYSWAAAGAAAASSAVAMAARANTANVIAPPVLAMSL